MKHFKKHGIAVLIIGLLVFVLFNSILNDYFLGDDFKFLNRTSQVGNVNSLMSFLIKPVAVYDFRPVVNLSFLIDYNIWHLNPFGYHLTNVIFHLGISILVYFLATFYFKNFWIGFASGLFFAILPNHHESVSWIAGRTDVICTFFILLTLFFWHFFSNRKKKIFYFISLVSFTFALLSKELALCLFLLILIIDYFIYKERKIKLFSFLKQRMKFYIPYLFLLGIYIFFRSLVIRQWKMGVFSPWDQPLESIFSSLIYYFGAPFLFITRLVNLSYLKEIVLSVSKAFLSESLYLSRVPLKLIGLIGWIILIVLIVLILLQGKKVFCSKNFWQNILFTFVWIYVCAFPVSFVLQFVEINLMCTRFLYLPGIGFCFLLAFLLFNNLQFRKVKKILFLFLIFFFCLLFVFNRQPWEEASKTTYDILSQLKNMHPTFVSSSVIYFSESFTVRGAYTFFVGFEDAVRLLYQNQRIKAHNRSKQEFNKLLSKFKSLENTYFFEWEPSTHNLKEL